MMRKIISCACIVSSVLDFFCQKFSASDTYLHFEEK